MFTDFNKITNPTWRKFITIHWMLPLLLVRSMLVFTNKKYLLYLLFYLYIHLLTSYSYRCFIWWHYHVFVNYNKLLPRDPCPDGKDMSVYVQLEGCPFNVFLFQWVLSDCFVVYTCLYLICRYTNLNESLS